MDVTWPVNIHAGSQPDQEQSNINKMVDLASQSTILQ